MYKRHKILIIILFGVSSFLAYGFNADYYKIAEPAINVTAIAIGIYTAAISSILGSNYAKKLALITSSESNYRTLLGVLSSYLHWAGILSLSTIILSILFLSNVIQNNNFIGEIISAISYGTFIINLILFGLIYLFLISSLNKSIR